MTCLEEIKKGIGCGATLGHGLSCTMGPVPQQTILCDPCINNAWLVEIAGKARLLAKRIEMNVCLCEIIPDDEIEKGKICIPCQARALLAELEGK